MMTLALALLLAPAPPLSPPPNELALLESLAGERRHVSLEELDVQDLAVEDVALISFQGLAAPRPLAGTSGEVEFVGGQRLVGEVSGGPEESLLVTVAEGAQLETSLDLLLSLRFRSRWPQNAALTVEPAPEGDRLYIVRGRGLDQLDGLLETIDEEGVTFESRVGSRRYAWGDVGALFLEPFAEGEAGEDRGGQVMIDLYSGSRLAGRLVRLDAGGVVLETGGGSLTLPLREVALVARDDGVMQFLSSLEPADIGPISPFGDDLGMTWAPRLDRAVGLGPLRAGERQWTRGIGVHAPSRVTWNLDGSWKQLRARLAVDDSVLDQNLVGSVVFRVLVDGEELAASRVIRGGDAPVLLPAVDLTGARELVLVVDPTEDGWFADRANWLVPVLTR